MPFVVGVGEVLGKGQYAAASFVHNLNGQSSPAWLAVFDDVEQKCSVGQFTGIGVIATVVNLDFNALLSEWAAVVVGEDDFQFLRVGMPGNEVGTVGGDDEVAQRCFGV